MQTLETLQAAFQSHLLDAPSDIAAAVRPGGRIGVERRLGVYHHAYRARLVEALKDSFGHTALYLGDEQFDAAARVFLAAHPSMHPNLRWFGGAFAGWLAEAWPGDPEVAELAQLDAALRRAFDGQDEAPLGLEALAALPPDAWDSAVLRWHPSCERLHLHCNTLSIWHALDCDEAPPAPLRLDVPTEVLVWRFGFQPHFRSLGAFEAQAIGLMWNGRPFAAACAALAAKFPDAEVIAEVGVLLRRWIDEGLLVAIDA
ncbi:putative DNA-binding domain-containing protein [Aquincola sp. S2]|uniref:DNA-binding domain-containing protein n=1 Tax=Pseudaquabacterium terrae TaxID=2732868 RepID=A0ABX2ESS3_9BURK|nr:putative DNA-binding domain-containing protein [Aquabacterium terrae]NRF71484.1 putative DNA-binding domain-containing protein [Aquabacterium terrae]